MSRSGNKAKVKEKKNAWDDVEFKCLSNFTPLEEYVSELEKGAIINEVEAKEPSNPTKDKSEWYKYAEDVMRSEKTKKKPLPEVSFDELLSYWMNQA